MANWNDLPLWDRIDAVRADEIAAIGLARELMPPAAHGSPRRVGVNETGRALRLKSGRIVMMTVEMTGETEAKVSDFFVVRADGSEICVKREKFLAHYREQKRAAAA